MNATDMTSKYLAGGRGAGQRWIDNIQRVTDSPGAAAADKTQQAVENYQAVVGSPAHEAKLRDPGFLGRWKAGAKIGQAKYTGAFAAGGKAERKYQAFAAAYQPVYASMKSAAKLAGPDPVARFSAALAVLQAASRHGSNPVSF